MPGGDSRLSNPAPGMSLDALRNRSMTHHDHGRIERPEGSQVHRDEAPGSEGTAAGMTGGPVPLAGSRPSDPLDKVGLRIPPQPIRPNADPCPLPSGQKCAQSWRGVQGIVLSSESSVSSAMAVSPGVPAPVFLAPKGHRQKPSPRRRGSRGFRVKEKAGSPSILGRDRPDGRQGVPALARLSFADAVQTNGFGLASCLSISPWGGPIQVVRHGLPLGNATQASVTLSIGRSRPHDFF